MKTNRSIVQIILVLATTLVPAARAQLTVNGIADKTVYSTSTTFTVPVQAGYDYRALLDGNPVAVGAAVAVRSVDYHELALWRTNQATAEVTNTVVRFIVVDPARGGSENGLPPWVPYPMIPSTVEEAAAGSIRLVAPETYPAGMPIPIVAWVEKEAGAPLRVNGTLSAPDHPSIVIRRGVGSGFLAGTNAPGTLTYAGQLAGLTTSKAIVVEGTTTWAAVSGTLSGTTTWPENSRISITGNTIIPAGSTLTVSPGTVVRVNPGLSVMVSGQLSIQGTPDRPVVFAPVSASQPWGGFYLTNSTTRFEATSAIFTGSGANPTAVPNSHRNEQCLFYCDNHSRLALTNCAAINLAGQFGHAVDAGTPWNDISIVRTLIQRCTTGGEFNGSSIQFLQSALIETPYETPVFDNGDEDGIYFTTGQYVVRDSLIGWTRDDGIDAGSGGGSSVTVSNTWIESTYHEAFAWSGGNRITTNLHTVCLNCGQGIECGWSSTANSPTDFVDDSFSTANLIGARFGDNYDWTYNGFLRVTNSLILHNYRDVWGVNWQDWTYRVSAMDIRGNRLTAPNPMHPDNEVWDPATDASRLAAFMTTPPDAPVGVGFALWNTQLGIEALTNPVPVRLSSFTTNRVTVSYSLEAPGQTLATGTVDFQPGETLKFIPPFGSQAGIDMIRLALAEPDHARITGSPVVWYIRSSTPANLTTLIPTGAIWKYQDFGTNSGTAWRQLDFDDSGWRGGQAELGYGDAKDGRPEAKVISYGPDANNKYITYYFRHSLVITNPAAYGDLTVRLKRDDGGIVYMNGKPVFISNMPSGTVDYLTRAPLASDDGANFYSTNSPASVLVTGTNVVAVEIHQESVTSSDVSFDLELTASPRPALRLVRFGSDWLMTWDAPGAVLEETSDMQNWTSRSATSPAPIDPTNLNRFYRLRLP